MCTRMLGTDAAIVLRSRLQLASRSSARVIQISGSEPSKYAIIGEALS